MRMDGDPHLTAWASLDAEPIGGQRAKDLDPQQVVGGYFLMGTEEKGCISQPSRQGILDKQGGPVPVSCRGDNLPLGVVGGQLADRNAQAGEENAPLTLSNCNSPPDFSQNPYYCTVELPLVINVPSETSLAPVSPHSLSQTPDQNVIFPIQPPQRDCLSHSLLGVQKTLVAGPVLPFETDPFPCCPAVSSIDTNQTPVPGSGDLDETPLFTFNVHCENDSKALSFHYLTPETDQIPSTDCLPRINDHSLVSEDPVASCTYQSPQFDPIVELSQSESNLDCRIIELPHVDAGAVHLACFEPPLDHDTVPLSHSSCHLDPNVEDLPQSDPKTDYGNLDVPQSSSQVDSVESCHEPDTDQWPHSSTDFKFRTDCLSHLQSNIYPDLLPQSECCLNSDVDELPEAETCLNLGPAELPEADSCVTSDTDDLAEAESFLNLEGDLPEAEACLNLNVSELPESDTCLATGVGDLPEADIFAVPDVSELPEAESFLIPNIGELPEAEASLNIGNELSEAESDLDDIFDDLPQSEACLHPNDQHLLQSDYCLDSDLLSFADPFLNPYPEEFSFPEPCLTSDLLPQSEPCSATDADRLPQIESHLRSSRLAESDVDLSIDHSKSNLTSDSDQLAQSEGNIDPDTNKLPQTLTCFVTDSSLSSQYPLQADSCPVPVHNSSLNSETDQLFQSKPFTNSSVDQTESRLPADTGLFFKGETSLAPELTLLSQLISKLGPKVDYPESCLNSKNDQVPDAQLNQNSKMLGHSDPDLRLDQRPLTDPCFQNDQSLLSPAFTQCSQSEPSLDTDSQSDLYIEQDTVQFCQSQLSFTDEGHDPESCSIPVIDKFPQSGSCLDIELLPLSETFLAHENDNFICSSSVSGSGLTSHSQTSSGNDQITLLSEFSDKETPTSEDSHIDSLVTFERPLTSNSDQLPTSESSLSDDTDFFCLCETFLAHEADQISPPALPEATDPELPLSKSVLMVDSNQLIPSNLPKAPNNDQLTLVLPHDAFSVAMVSSTNNFNGLHKACLDSDSEHLLKLETCLNDNTDQVSKSSVSCITHMMPLTTAPLPPHTDHLPSSEHFYAINAAGQLPLSMAKTSDLPLLESSLDLDSDNVSKLDSSLPNHSPLLDSVLPGHSELIESQTDFPSEQLLQSESVHDMDLQHISECLIAPNLEDLNLSDLCLTPDIDQFPLKMSTVDSDTKESMLDKFLTSCDNHSLLPESINDLTSDSLSNNADHLHPSEISGHQLPLCNSNVQLLSSNVDHPLPELSVKSRTGQSCLSSEVDQPELANLSSLDSASEFVQITSVNTSFSNSIVEKFHIPWDWSSDLEHADFTGDGADRGSDFYVTLPSDDPSIQPSEIDGFPLFCFDTPPESPIESPEIDPLTLSADLLSLCDVFSQLQASDMACPDINGDLCNDLDILSLHRKDSDLRAVQVPTIEEEMSMVIDPPPTNLPNMPASNGQVGFNTEDNQNLNGISDHDVIDRLDSYCLDLLFEPELVPCEMKSSPTVDPCSQLHIDPSFGSISNNVTGHLACDITKPSQSLVYETQTTPPLGALCISNLLSPGCQSGSTFHNNHLAQSNSYVGTEIGSASQLLGGTSRKNMLDLFNGLTENNQDVLFGESQEALPPDKLVQPAIDTPVWNEEVSPCDSTGLVFLLSQERDIVQVSAGSSNLGEQFLPNYTSQSKPVVDSSDEKNEKLALSRPASPLENTQVLPCDPADLPDSVSAPFSFGEGDPFLAFALDNDSPCVGDELARLRAVFDALDRDKDGFVKMEDFVQFATVYGAEQVKYLTGYLDPAGLGVINFRDFYRGIAEIQNEDLDMQLYDMGYPAEGEPACSVDFDDLAAFEVTEVTDSAYVGSESAYSECETFTDEDTGGPAAQEDPETEGDGTGSRGHTSASPEGLELSLCDISVVTVAGQEEQFEDFGEGAEPDLFSSHCEDEPESFGETSDSNPRLTSSVVPVSDRQLLAPPTCSALGGLYCSQCHKHINRLEDLSTRLRYLEMDSPDKRTCSRKEARRLHHNGFIGEEPEEPQQTEMAYDDTDLTDKVVYLEQRVSELERDAATTSEQQNRLRHENLQLLHRAHALEEQLKDQELMSDEVQSEETRKHRDELRKMERDRSYRLTSLKARLQELESENLDLRSQLPGVKATTQRLEEEKLKLLDQVEDLQFQLQDHQEQNRKLGGKLSKELHKQQTEKERCQEVIEELRRELEQMQLVRLEMEQKMGLGNSAALQEYNSRTREAELEHEVRRLKQEQRALKEQNEELNGQIINLSIQGAKNLFSTTFSDSLAAEISSVSRDELMEAIHKQEEINLRLQDYIDRIIVAIMETNPAILEVKFH